MTEIKWIETAKELPPDETYVLIYAHHAVYIGLYGSDYNSWDKIKGKHTKNSWHLACGRKISTAPSHWMLLPKSPYK